MKLGDVLSDPAKFGSGWLFLARGIEWDVHSEALVLDTEEVAPEHETDPDAGVPEAARMRQLTAILTIADVQDIVSNARQQRPHATQNELLDAFKFYVRRDAFIEF